MSTRAAVATWAVQRVTAAILAIAVTVHLVTLVNAVRGGLSGYEIVSRLSGHDGWLAFYAVFAIAAAVHGAIGLRAMACESPGFSPRLATAAAVAFALFVSWLGLRAALGLYGASAL